jgi:hypothetical protein
MAAPYVTGLELGDHVEIGVVQGLVDDDVEDKCADEEYSGEDEYQETMPEHFELVIFRDHCLILY